MCDKVAYWRVWPRGCDTYTYVCYEHLHSIVQGSEYGVMVKRHQYPDSILFACNWSETDPTTVEVTTPALLSIAVKVINLIEKKNADYGDAWQKQGMPGLATRISDKMSRIDRLMDGREAVVESESLEDTLIDAIGYCMLGLLYLEARQCQSTPAKSAD